MRFADIAGVVFGSDVAYAKASTETTASATLKTPFEGTGGIVDWDESITLYVGILILIIVIFTAIFERRRLR